MATSLVTFDGPVDFHGSHLTGDVEFIFQPPSNLAGKLCYVECRLFHYSYTQRPLSIHEGDAFTLKMDWATPQAVTTNINDTRPGSICATVSVYGPSNSVGPMLVQIPNGPQRLRAVVAHSRGAQITEDPEMEAATIIAVFAMTEANARKAPLG